jgi:hypothetical protein
MSSITCPYHPREHDDDVAQRAVLTVILDAHPAQRSIDELGRELSEHPTEFGERDRIDRAIRDLIGTGLVHRHGQFVFATLAAVRFDELGL